MRPDPGNHPPAEPPTEILALGKHLAMTSCTECHGRDLNGYPGDTPPLIVAKAYSAENFIAPDADRHHRQRHEIGHAA